MGAPRSRGIRLGIAGTMIATTLIACEQSASTPPPAAATQPPAAPAANAASIPPAPRPDPPRVLIYSRTVGFRHDSIEAGVAALERIANMSHWRLGWSEDPTVFTDQMLDTFDVVVFLNTTGDVLNDEQQGAFERFIAAGHGFVGIHAAADTEYDWAWYGGLVGAYFKGHPAVQQAQIVIEHVEHPSMRDIPEPWFRSDEWYDYLSNPRDVPGEAAVDGDPAPDAPASRITILARVLESTYEGGGMGEDHPIAWCHQYAGGRAWYTGGGHTIESYNEPMFLKHLVGGILWAAGQD